jgi:2-polyprenyl-6-methoxyphenol hydroxylase-like FAD-dependent oxidoreductase
LGVCQLRTQCFDGESTSQSGSRLIHWARPAPACPLFPNGLRQLERMKLGDALAGVGAKIGEGSGYYRMDGTFVSRVVTTDSTGWNGIHGMHRANLLRVLAGGLPSTAIRWGHRCIGFEQSAFFAHLKFATGQTDTADVVIAADGIQSSLQIYVVEPSTPEYSGSRAYRGLIPREKVPEWPKEAHQIWMGDGKHFMVYPVRSGRLLNYVGFVPTRSETIESWSASREPSARSQVWQQRRGKNRTDLAAALMDWRPRLFDFRHARFEVRQAHVTAS